VTVETAIAEVYPDRVLLRGYDLSKMAGRYSFGDTVYLLATGDLPPGKEGDLLEAMMVISAVHGIDSPSTHTARAVANCGVPLQSAVAAGISAIGENHGGAGERCARLLQDAVAAEPTRPVNELAEQIVAEARAEKRRLPGFGHRLHDPDPRAVRLLTLAAQWNLSGQHTALALAIVSTLREATGRSLPLNVDGAIGALISDLGMHWRYGKAMFILGRAAGFVAHVQEELETGKPFQFASKLDVLYVGAAERPLPD
jgi:citrate synthase